MANEFRYGIAGLPMTWSNPWFSRTTRNTWSTAGTAGVGEGVGVGIGVGVAVGTGVGVGVGGAGVAVGAGEALDATVEVPPPQPHIPSKTTVVIKSPEHAFSIATPLR